MDVIATRDLTSPEIEEVCIVITEATEIQVSGDMVVVIMRDGVRIATLSSQKTTHKLFVPDEYCFVMSGVCTQGVLSSGSIDTGSGGGPGGGGSTQTTVRMEDLCVTVDGSEAQYATPIITVDTATGAITNKIWVDSMGDIIAGAVVASDPCDCDCVECDAPEFHQCLTMNGFDNYNQDSLDPLDTTAIELLIDGVSQSVTVYDIYDTTDNINKSSWYVDPIAAINALPNWTATILFDVPVGTQDVRPTWTTLYDGPGNEELQIRKASSVGNLANEDIYFIRVDAAGVVTTSVIEQGNPEMPDYGTPIFGTCRG